jgi:hypothetical protein
MSSISKKYFTFDNQIYDECIKDTFTWPCINDIIFAWQFNNDITDIKWPIDLHSLHFGSYFNQDISNINWHKYANLYSVKLGHNYNKNINDIDWHIISLTYSWGYNHEIIRLPKSLTMLNIGGNKHNLDIISILPESWESLESLDLGFHFNHNIDKIKWPKSLRTLNFSEYFNQPMLHVDFSSIEKIAFGYAFNQSLDDVCWPEILYLLSIGAKFRQDISHVKFKQIYEIKDYSCSITINSCPFPKSLHLISHYFNLSKHPDTIFEIATYVDNYQFVTIYRRNVGQYTKMAHNY